MALTSTPTISVATVDGSGNDLPTFSPPAMANISGDQQIVRRVTALIGGSTVPLGDFTTVAAVYIYNHDATNFVTMAYDDAGSTGREIKISKQELVVIGSDFDTGTDITLTADTGSCECSILILGTA